MALTNSISPSTAALLHSTADPASVHPHHAQNQTQLSTALSAELASLVPASVMDKLQSLDVIGKLGQLESMRLGGLSTVLAGVVEWLLVPGRTRKSWSVDFHLAMKVIRTHVKFSAPALSRSRERLISYLLPPPLRTSINPTSFFVDVSAIVEEEEASRNITGGFGRAGYIIPPEMQWGGESEDADLRADSGADGAGSWLGENVAGQGAPRYDNGPQPQAPLGVAPEKRKRRPRVHELAGEWVSWYGEEPPLASQAGGTPTVKRRGSIVEWAVEEAKRTVWYEAMGTKVEDRSSGPKGVVLYLHGGAFALGSPRTHRMITSKISKLTGLPVLAIDYRLAPEDPFPAGLHDALAAWLYLTQPNHAAVHLQSGAKGPALGSFKPEEIVVMGDSAGGNLTLSLCMYLKHFLVDAQGNPKFGLPKGICLLSPSTDQTMRHNSYSRNAEFDYLPSPITWKQFGSVNLFLDSSTEVGKPYNPISGYAWGPIPNPNRRMSLRVPTDKLSKEVKPPPELIPSAAAGQGHRRDSVASNNSNNNNRRISDPPLREVPMSNNGRRSSILSSWSSFMEEPTFSRARSGSFSVPAEPTKEDLVYTALRHPCFSPYHGSFEGLPPALFQAGECELLVDEIVAAAHKYAAQNPGEGKVRCEIFHDLTHVPHAYPGSRGGAVALRNIGRFVRNLFSEDDAAKHVHEEDPHILRSLELGKEAGDVEVFYGNFDEEQEDGDELLEEEEDQVKLSESDLEKLRQLGKGVIPEDLAEESDLDHDFIPGAI